jgi:hypothetical protein
MVRPWRYDYEGMIVNYLVKEQLFSIVKDGYLWGKIPVAKRGLSYPPMKKSRKELYDEINRIRREQDKRVKRISESKLSSVLNGLKDKHVLFEYSKGGHKNKRFYRLETRTLIDCLGFILLSMKRLLERDRNRYGAFAINLMGIILRFFLRMAE